MSNNQLIALITGASGGIGLATAKLLKKNGWLVHGIDLHMIDDIDAIFDGFYEIDLSKSGEDDYLKILEEFPRLDSIIHCAAMQICGKIINLDIDQYWESLMNVNVKCIYQLSKCSYSRLVKNRGNVVIVSSVHAYQSSKDISMYAISKCALSGVIRNLALEWAEKGIRVNGVAPGAVDTKMLRDGLRRNSLLSVEGGLEKLANRHLIKRILQPEEIAEVILFLASNQKSSAITGQTIIADGCVTSLLSSEVD